MYFIKDSKIKDFKVKNNKVLTTIIIENHNITNPTLNQFKSIGWKEYIPEQDLHVVSVPHILSYEELVELYIREHGYPTYGSELAVINNYSENPAEYLEAWLHYQGVRHEAKEWAANKQYSNDTIVK